MASGGNNPNVETVIQELTCEGSVEFDYCFVLEGDYLCAWYAAQDGFIHYSIDDDDLCLACVQYIKDNSDRSFVAFSDLVKYAHSHSWPKLQQFDKELSAWQLRLRQTEGNGAP